MAELAAETHARGSVWRPLRVGLAVLLTCAVAWVSLVSLHIAFPRHGVDGRYDAIISLAPGEFRLPTALELYSSGRVAEHLAVSWIASDAHLGEEMYSRVELQTHVCVTNTDPAVSCFEPVEDSTLGEALGVRELIVANGWTRVLLVTDRTHAFRARYVFEQCMPDGVEVDVEVAPTEITPRDWWEELVYENGAIVKAIWQTNLRCR